jgi:acetylornithine deacetylase/succinyl-diaminopimelate desuccinylase-like protein
MSPNSNRLAEFCRKHWEESALPELTRYIRIPNKSPMFDPDWEKHGHMEQVVQQFVRWCNGTNIPGMQLEVVRLPGRTPLIYMDIPGLSPHTVLLYGHLDKQPEMTGWREGLGPWQPVLEGDRLYGRGGADDGYATFASLISIMALRDQSIPHARCVVIIEACEESGSPDLPFYIEELAGRIGTPDLVICLDSGCGNYDQLWCTTSLRGLVGGRLDIEILEEGVHSGDASGIVPSSFRILRQLLNRIDDCDSGTVFAGEFNATIPAKRVAQARAAAKVLGDTVYTKFPFVKNGRPLVKNPTELILNRTWRPALAITGADGLPAIAQAGNVLRGKTSVKISLRLPPTVDAQTTSQKLKSLLEEHPPYGAKVRFTPDWAAHGWHAPETEPWLEQALDEASLHHFGNNAMHMGEGGTIPFMAMLGARFPGAQFLITGVLGPHSNAHGPNEFLHLPTARKLTCCVAEVIAHHYQHVRQQT